MGLNVPFKKIDRKQKIGEPIVVLISIDELQANGEYEGIADISAWAITAKARADSPEGSEVGTLTRSSVDLATAQMSLATVGFSAGLYAVDLRAGLGGDVFYTKTLYFELEVAVTR